MKQRLLIFIVTLLPITTNAQFGNSLSTDGVQDYIIVPDNNAIDLIDNFTIECWIQTRRDDNNNLVLFRKGWCSGGDNSYYLSVQNGIVKWHWNSSGDCNYPHSYETIDPVVFAGVCTHLTIVHSSSEIKIYVNNVLVPGILTNGNYSTVNNSSEQLDIGAYRNLSGSYSSYYWGTIDELRFWNYRLTEQEIIDYSNAPLTGTEPGLVAYFDMEDTGQGTSLTITNKATVSGSIIGQAFGSSISPQFVSSCIVLSNTDNVVTNPDIHIFPNLTENIITINIDKSIHKNILVELINIYGRMLESQAYNSKKIKFDISKYNSGLYFLRVIDNKGFVLKIEKIFKK